MCGKKVFCITAAARNENLAEEESLASIEPRYPAISLFFSILGALFPLLLLRDGTPFPLLLFSLPDQSTGAQVKVRG